MDQSGEARYGDVVSGAGGARGLEDLRGNPRAVAYEALAEHAERMPDLLPSEPDTGEMSDRDAALTHAIIEGTVRRWNTLVYVVSKVGGRSVGELEPAMQAALLGGAAQILFFDRLPDHAILDETVEWAKHAMRPKAGSMTNAILRNLVRARLGYDGRWDRGTDSFPCSDGRAVVIERVTLPEAMDARIAVACSLPRGLVRSWMKLGELQGVDPMELALHSLVRPPTVCRMGNALVSDGSPLVAHEQAGHAVFTGPRRQLAEFLEAHPGVFVQDSAASHVVDGLEEMSIGSDGVIVDLCAGRGTKTRQLVERFPGARVVAAEVDGDRLDALDAVFDHEERVDVMHVDDLAREGAGWADLVLTDVPCSNSGVLARRTEARYRVRTGALQRLIETQRAILTNARKMVRPGGRLVYSTCSLEPEENSLQAAWAAETLGLVVERERAVLPSGLPGDEATIYRDGSYAAEMTVAS